MAFIDSDDEYHPEFLEKLHEAARTYDADIAVCGHTIRHSDGTEVHRAKVTPGVHEGEDIAIEFLEDRYTGFMCDKIFRAQLFDGGAVRRRYSSRRRCPRRLRLLHEGKTPGWHRECAPPREVFEEFGVVFVV